MKLTFKEFVIEREAIRLGKSTNDSILRDYHFTNIDRAKDAGSIKLKEYTKGMSLEDKLYYAAKYRYYCSGRYFFDGIQDSIKMPAYQPPRCRKGERWLDVVDQMLELLTPDVIAPTMVQTAININNVTKQVNGFNYIFYAGEIAKDLAMITDLVDPLSECMIGKGADIGYHAMNGVIQKDPTRCLKGIMLIDQHENIKQRIYDLMFDDWSFSNIEHALCEYGKYLKIREFGTGRKRKKSNQIQLI